MVTDPFKILCNHHKLDRLVAVAAVFFDKLDKLVFYRDEKFIHSVIKSDDLVSKSLVIVNKGIYALSDHFYGEISHSGNVCELFDISIARHRINKISDVCRLISKALNVGDHLQRGGYLTKILRNRLLLEKDTHALLFNCHLVFVHALIHHANAFSKLSVTVYKRGNSIRDHLLGKSAHLGKLCF